MHEIMTPSPSVDPAIFAHVRTAISIIVGLSIGRLLTGLARFVQHPGQHKVYGVHLVWTFFMLLQVIYFWWWEFHLSAVQWTFPLYCFVVLYASLFFFMCTLLFPDAMNEYKGFADYFMSRRKWFFGFLIVAFLMDIVDTLSKGEAYLALLGPEYWLRIALYIGLSAIAIHSTSPRFHMTFAVGALVAEIGWAVSLYDTLQ